MYKAIREFQAEDLPPQLLLDVVADVASYPEFVKGIQGVEVLERGAQETLARFTAGVAGMKFVYSLRCVREEDQVSWRRVSGAFCDVGGSFVHLGGRRYRYTNALDPGFSAPGFAVRFVLERSLPRLIRDFQERARSLQRDESGSS